MTKAPRNQAKTYFSHKVPQIHALRRKTGEISPKTSVSLSQDLWLKYAPRWGQTACKAPLVRHLDSPSPKTTAMTGFLVWPETPETGFRSLFIEPFFIFLFYFKTYRLGIEGLATYLGLATGLWTWWQQIRKWCGISTTSNKNPRSMRTAVLRGAPDLIAAGLCRPRIEQVAVEI